MVWVLPFAHRHLWVQKGSTTKNFEKLSPDREGRRGSFGNHGEIQRLLLVAEWMCPREKSPELSASESRFHGCGRQAKNARKWQIPKLASTVAGNCEAQRSSSIDKKPDEVGEAYLDPPRTRSPRRVLVITDRAGRRTVTTSVIEFTQASRRAARCGSRRQISIKQSKRR